MNETEKELNREIKDMYEQMTDPRRQEERELKKEIERKKEFRIRRFGL